MCRAAIISSQYATDGLSIRPNTELFVSKITDAEREKEGERDRGRNEERLMKEDDARVQRRVCEQGWRQKVED